MIYGLSAATSNACACALCHVQPTNFPVPLAFAVRVFFVVPRTSLHPPNDDDAFDMSALPFRIMCTYCHQHPSAAYIMYPLQPEDYAGRVPNSYTYLYTVCVGSKPEKNNRCPANQFILHAAAILFSIFCARCCCICDLRPSPI